MPQTIATPRLMLTQWRADHFEVVAAYNADAQSTRYTGGVLSREDAWRGLAEMIGHWALRGFGLYAVEEPSGALIGGVGLYFPEGWPALELGFDLMPPARGKGYATEAAAAVRDRAAANGLTELSSLIHPENRASIAVAERLGAVHDGMLDVRGVPHRHYRHAMQRKRAA